MNGKERLLNSIKGIETDRLAWSPLLPYFWETQPLAVRKKGKLEFYKMVGADPLIRGFCELIKKIIKNASLPKTYQVIKNLLQLKRPWVSSGQNTHIPQKVIHGLSLDIP